MNRIISGTTFPTTLFVRVVRCACFTWTGPVCTCVYEDASLDTKHGETVFELSDRHFIPSRRSHPNMSSPGVIQINLS